MITKEKVVKIIHDFDSVSLGKKSGAQYTEDLKISEYSNKEKILYTYLKELSLSEYMDLCSLVDVGRTCAQNGVKPTLSKYRVVRKKFEENYQYEEIFPNYLLGKPQLSTYLRNILCLFDEMGIGF